MDNEENFSNWQSAVSGIQAENISIGDINQSIINSSSARYNHIGVIVSEYNRKIAKLEKSYKDRVRFNQKSLYKQCNDYLKELEKKIEEYQQSIEHSQQILKQSETTFKTTAKIMESSKDYEPDSLWNVANMLASATAATYFFHGDIREISKSIEETEQKKAETEKDIDEFEPLIKLVAEFLRINVLDLDIDQILDEKSLSNFSSSSREDIEFIKDRYKAQQQELEDSYNQDFARYKTEKNTSIYREELQYCLDEDGYPLSLEKTRFLESRLRGFDLDKAEIESITKELIKPFAMKYLKEYEEAYKDRLSKESFPLCENSVKKLKEYKETLGLNAFGFLELETQVIEENLVKPFYQSNFQEYRRNYRQKLEERGLLISAKDVIQLNNLQISLGLKAFTFSD